MTHRRAAKVVILAACAGTAALGAALLMVIQPLVARLILPHLGGGPAVWQSVLFFFQLTVFAGYAYVSGLMRLPSKARWWIHAGLVGMALYALAVLDRRVLSIPEQASVLAVLLFLAGSVGLPCLVLATTSPLLQLWSARPGSRATDVHYWLYGAANAGTICGLFSYPFVLEPLFGLGEQLHLWSIVCVAAMLTSLIVGGYTDRHSRSASTEFPKRHCTIGAPAFLEWVVAGAAATWVMMAASMHVQLDLGASPIVWLAPLGAYLLAFLLAAAGYGDPSRPVFRYVALLSLLFLGVSDATKELTTGVGFVALRVPVLVLSVAVACLALISSAWRTRPDAHGLPLFYVGLALGGLIAGCGSAVILPALLDTAPDLSLAILLAAAILAAGGMASAYCRLAMAALTLVLVALLYLGLSLAPQGLFGVAGVMSWSGYRTAVIVAVFGVAAAVGVSRSRSGVWCGIAVVVAGAMAEMEPVVVRRSFFGTIRVVNSSGYRLLIHGNTLHGAQRVQGGVDPAPLTYYADSGPVGDAFRQLRNRKTAAKIGVVGLGVGTIAAYAAPGDTMTFIEIDRDVIAVARDETVFRYLAAAAARGATVRVVEGDGRQRLGGLGDECDLLVVDAFTSDAVPVHMLTREALSLYERAIRSDGRILIHASNRYYDLAGVVAGTARSLGMPIAIWEYKGSGTIDEMAATWIRLARRGTSMDEAKRTDTHRPGWTEPEIVAREGWTDDVIDLIGALRR